MGNKEVGECQYMYRVVIAIQRSENVNTVVEAVGTREQQRGLCMAIQWRQHWALGTCEVCECQ